MVYTNLTNLTSNVGLTEGIVNINSALNSLPFIGLLVLTWIAVFSYSINRAMDALDSFLTSSFVVSIITILGYWSGLIQKEIIIIPLLLLFVAIIIRMTR